MSNTAQSMKRMAMTFSCFMFIAAACGPPDVVSPETGYSEATQDRATRAPRDAQASLNPKGPTADVARVVDGDTIEVSLGKRSLDVRLIGIDTPESVHPTVADECFGLAASRYTKLHLEGKRIKLTFDVERRDHYGRVLAYVWTSEGLFNTQIVKDGFAQAYTVPPNVHHAARILRAQRAARRANAGLWSRCSRGTAHAPKPGATPLAAGPADDCTSGYDPCLPPAPDYDCFGGEGDGPKYVKGPVRVSGSDPYQLDEDGDGKACALQ